MVKFDDLKPKISELAKKYHLSLVAVFGSQVSGKIHTKSDFDLAFLSEKSMGLLDIAKMQTEFSDNLKIKNLEMVSLNGASPFLAKQVSQKGTVLYEAAPSLFAKFKIHSFKKFMETKKLFDMRELSFNKFLKKYD